MTGCESAASHGPPRRVRGQLVALSLGLSAFMFAGLWHGYSHWQVVVWLASLALLVAACGNESGDRIGTQEPWTASERAVLATIVLLTVAFRVYRLDDLPPGLWIDECNVTYHAVQLMNGDKFLPFGCLPLTWLEAWVQTSNLYLYSLVLLFRTMGYGYWAIKMASVLPGIVGVPALYLLCREFAGRWTAMFAGVFLAVGHWNVRLSRWGWDEVAMTTLQILSCYLLVRGFRRERSRDFVVAGILMGLCLYTYVASRLAFAASLACLGLWIVSRWGNWVRRAQPLVLFTLATVLTIAPLSVFYLQHPNLLNVRTKEVSIFRRVEQAGRLDPLWANVRRHLLMFHVSGDWIPKHALPHKPMLDPITGVLFPIGLVVCLWRWRTPPYLLCVCWLGFGLLAGMLSENGDAPHAYRTGNVAPVVMVMAALPLGWIGARLASRNWLGRAGPALATVMAVAVTAPVVWLNYQNYFVRWAGMKELWDDMMVARGTNAARYVLRHMSGQTPYVSRWVLDAGFSTLMRRDVTPRPPETRNWNPDYWNPDTNPPLRDASADVSYLCDPSWRPWIEGWYPHTRWTNVRNQFGDVYFARAEIPAADIAATLGLRRQVLRDGAVPASLRDGPARTVLEGLRGTWTVFDGMYYQRLPEFVTWAVPNTDAAGLWFDGQRVLAAGTQLSPEDAAQSGLHSILVLLEGERDRPPPLLVRSRWLRGTPVPLDALTPPPPLSGAHGLRGRFYGNAQWSGDPVQTVDAALPGIPAGHPPAPFSAIWDGSLHAEQDGEYVLGTAMNDGGSVEIDGTQVIENRGAYAETRVQLAAGPHAITVKQYDTGDGTFLSLLWVPPGSRETVPDGNWAARQFAPVRDDTLFHLPFAGSGLRARYFANTRFEGTPFLTTVEAGRWLSHHQGNAFSVQLDGRLYFPTTDEYQLGLNSDDGSWLYLDGDLLVDNGGVHGLAPLFKRVSVSQGWHTLLVKYFQERDAASLQVLWGQGDAPPGPIPPVFMEPGR